VLGEALRGGYTGSAGPVRAATDNSRLLDEIAMDGLDGDGGDIGGGSVTVVVVAAAAVAAVSGGGGGITGL